VNPGPSAHRGGDALALAVSWLTVVPARVRGEVDRTVAARAIGLAPLVGLALGGAAAGLLRVLDALGAPGLLAGLLVVGALAVGTRGMHLDGLADTVDGLGCYGPPERALAVMRDGSTGPFAVVALVVVLGAQAAALGTLAADGRWGAVVVGVAAGRVALGWVCRRGAPAARPDGLGALVAGTQPVVVPVGWALLLALAAVAAVDGRVWQGPAAVLAAGALVVVGVRHAVRRFGGMTGDVLGACSEVAVTTSLVVLALG
jgi:adenosylcobinamide-GDP ribazoletransferase